MKNFYIIFITILLFKYCYFLTSDDIIYLPEPEKEGGMPLNEALSKRKSSRDFDPSIEITPEILSQALWSCYGTNRPNGYKTTPSAVAWFPLLVYVFVEDGVYQYNATNHSLIKLLSGDYRIMTGTQTAVVTKAGVNFIFIADYNKPSSLDDESKFKYIYLDTGHCSMALGLFAASNNMKGVPRAMVDIDPLLKLLKLDKENYVFTLAFSLGY